MTTRIETKVPAIPAPTDDNLKEVVGAIKELLEVRNGISGNALDTGVTFRDLVALNLAASEDQAANTDAQKNSTLPVSGWYNPQSGGYDYDPTKDLTTPPAPTDLQAAATQTAILLSWSQSGYRNRAYSEVWRSGNANIGDAIKIGTSSTQFYTDVVGEEKTFYYWVRDVSEAGVTGPYNTAPATATTGIDIEATMKKLTGQIQESHLYRSLSTKISLLDPASPYPDSISGRVYAETQKRVESINAEAATRAQALLDEVAARSSAISNLQTQINLLSAASSGDFSQLLAAVQDEQAARADAVAAEALSRETLATQMRGSYTGTDVAQLTTGLMYNERIARSSADSALSSSISSLQATVTGNYNTLSSAITTEQTARADQDTALATLITNVSAKADSKSKVTRSATAPANPSVGDVWIDSNSDYNPSYAGSDFTVPRHRQYLWTGTAWLDILDADFRDLWTSYTNEVTSRVNGDTALSTAITNLTSTVTGNYNTLTAAIQTEATTRANGDSAVSQQLSTLSATVTSNNTTLTAAVQQEATARANTDDTLLAQYTVKVDAGGKVAGFGLASTSSLAGGSTSSFAVRADKFYIASPAGGANAGDQIPFIVDTTTGKTYISSAFIKDAQITNAMIQNLTANKITSGYTSATIGINGAKVYGAELYSGGTVSISYDASGNITGFVPTNPTVNISNGNAYFLATSFKIQSSSANDLNSAVVPFEVMNGTVYIKAAMIANATITEAKIKDGEITNAKIKDTIQSSDFVTGSAGWKIDKAGSAELNNATFRGTLDVKSAASGARTVIKSNVIKVYDTNGTLRVQLGDLNA